MVTELEELKQYLPKGYSKKLALEFGVTEATISYALSGKTKRFDIIKRAVEMAHESLKITEDLKSVVTELKKQ